MSPTTTPTFSLGSNSAAGSPTVTTLRKGQTLHVASVQSKKAQGRDTVGRGMRLHVLQSSSPWSRVSQRRHAIAALSEDSRRLSQSDRTLNVSVPLGSDSHGIVLDVEDHDDARPRRPRSAEASVC